MGLYFLCTLLHFLTRTDIDMRAGGFFKLMHWPGLDPGIFVKCRFFPHISACCRFGAILLHHCRGRIHILQGSFSADPCMLANPLRSHAFN